MEYQSFNTPEEVYQDFKGRRDGILKALTVDVDKFYAQCDPEKENLCLYGYADKAWEVNLPAEEVPPEIPEPALGINFARDGMQRSDWLQLVAMHSDTWLISVAFFNGSRLDAGQRQELFNLINSSHTLYEIVSGRAKPAPKPKTQKPAAKAAPQEKPKKHQLEAPRSGKPTKVKPQPAPDAPVEDDDDYNDGDGDPCPACGGFYRTDEFWIACDGCETWYHGKCVKVSPQNADRIKTWKCPHCTKRQRT